MKKLFVVVLSTVLTTGFVTSCQQSKEKTEHSDTEKAGDETTEVIYTCPMHPEVESKAPGTCSKCGMELVKKESGHEEMEHIHTDSTNHE